MPVGITRDQFQYIVLFSALTFPISSFSLGIALHGSGHGHSHGLGGGHGHSHGNGSDKEKDLESPSDSSHSHSHSESEGLLKSKSKLRKDLNVRAAFIHVLGDLVQSVGVFIAALMIYFKVSSTEHSLKK